MTKILAQSIHLVFEQASDDSIVCKAQYGVSSEGIGATREVDVPLTPAQKQTIQGFARNVVLPVIKLAEQVA